MKHDTGRSWSDGLQKLTIENFENMDFGFGPHGVVLKNIDGRYGKIDLKNAVQQIVKIEIFDSDEINEYDDIRKAVGDGWVLD